MLRIKRTVAKVPKLNNPILIEGLPGIGNVGKVVVDYLIDELKAKKLMEITSYSFPHSVFVDENNIVELPKIELYYKKFNNRKKRDILLLAGDIQPVSEEASYEFSHKILDILKELKGREVITLGGIGLNSVPENPKVFCTGTSKDFVNKYAKGSNLNKNLFGIVGPIMGVSGLLIGLAKERGINGVCLLAETNSHPFYLGVKGSEEILKVLNKKLSLNLNLKQFSKEVSEIEKELEKKVELISKVSTKNILKKIKKSDVDYIG